MEDDSNASSNTVTGYLFQSTSPVWRTTLHNRQNRFKNEFQSTSPVLRTTLQYGLSHAETEDFNPRPPCGGRRQRKRQPNRMIRFQSTSPVWRTTLERRRDERARYISIHVPRVEDDVVRQAGDSRLSHFNPRPPCGGRHMHKPHIKETTKFQSTSPVWRTT